MSTDILPMSVERGSVYVVALESIADAVDGRIAKTRPAVVLEVEATGWDSGRVTIVPGTSTERALPSHIRVPPSEGGLDQTTFFICGQTRTVDLDWLDEKIGELSESTMAEIEEHLREHPGDDEYERYF